MMSDAIHFSSKFHYTSYFPPQRLYVRSMSSFKGQDQQSKCRKMSCMYQMQAAFHSIWLETSCLGPAHFLSGALSVTGFDMGLGQVKIFKMEGQANLLEKGN